MNTTKNKLISDIVDAIEDRKSGLYSEEEFDKKTDEIAAKIYWLKMQSQEGMEDARFDYHPRPEEV